MAVQSISYGDKTDLNTTSVPDANKVKASDMNDVKSVVNNNATELGTTQTQLGNLNTFDNTEKVVGTWIDGKPLYRKTYTISSPGSGEWTYTNTINNLGIAMFDKDHTFLLRSNGTCMTGIGAEGNSGYWFDARAITSTGSLMFYVGSSINSGATIYATILYTKTTD